MLKNNQNWAGKTWEHQLGVWKTPTLIFGDF